MSEPEPRRSVRATKGQHTRPLDELDQAAGPKRRQNKKPGASKKLKGKEETPAEDEGDELIRCVCGALEQDDDPNLSWVACDGCGAWQHNICVGVSVYDDEIPDKYWCEQCKPEDHKELLEGIKRGEKPWEDRHKRHEEKIAEEKRQKEEEKKNKKTGKRKSRGGPLLRKTDAKTSAEPQKPSDDSPGPVETPAESKPMVEPKTEATPDQTPAVEASAPEDATTAAAASSGKRKTREDAGESEDKAAKVRRVSPEPAQPPLPSVKPKYTEPKDLAPSIDELPPTRKNPAKALKKSLLHVMTDMAKTGELEVAENSTVDGMAERSAIRIEYAVFETHPMAKGQKEYSQQTRSLTFNLKNNPELVRGLLHGLHTPPTLAVMTSDEMASADLQKQNAEMKAKADKASILYQGDASGPRVRRTHKGEEVVEDENSAMVETPVPLPPMGGGGRKPNLPAEGDKSEDGPTALARSQSRDEGTTADGRSPSQPNFDINKVFSQVRSPSVSQARRPSAPVPQATPGEDADVDRMLQDENDSPPYSPAEEQQDPDVVWRGSLAMTSIANFSATAKYIAGGDFAKHGSWDKLINPRLSVAGRISHDQANTYLCNQRWSQTNDVIIVSFSPVSDDKRPEFFAMIQYFLDKKRYGVVGEKVLANVRDTYLVPVSPGDDIPEFLHNLNDNFVPKERTEPLLLGVFVWKNDPGELKLGDKTQPASSGTPVAPNQRSNSVSQGPGFSPATPVGANGYPLQSTTPVPIPQPPYTSRTTHPTAAAMQPHPPHHDPAAVAQGQAVALEVLGPEFMTCPTVQFLLPQAADMKKKEWEVIRGLYEREPKSRDDLGFLGQLLEKSRMEGNEAH
ncbi:Spen-like protein [Emericellopsis cladophorae]|uniref:Transcription factor BYE1 n=1 Tax=Emericellopsis cladophorae TaxID=2686198 RepID=A0A9P9XVV7_9HYPO|nr:Spen-like protein [Emericellopsis cladophorae]KAI6778548.1 Spen-like protein [Emericellopsis cladophorae]